MYVPTAELLERAHATVAGKTRSYVDDARAYARALIAIGTGIVLHVNGVRHELLEPSEEITRLRRENKNLTDNLTAVQTRCTELKEELRLARVDSFGVPLMPAQPTPRYDDVFAEGMAWLDSLAAEPSPHVDLPNVET